MSQRILLIQSDATDAKVVMSALMGAADPTFEVEWVITCAEGLERLQGTAAILVDLLLPDSRGIDTFDRLYDAGPKIPIMVLADLQNEQLAKLAMRRGAQDYLFIRRDAHLLPKVVSNMIERAGYAETLFERNERAQLLLNSIGDAVVSTNVLGQITYLNAIAEILTGWSLEEANGRPVEGVCQMIDATSRRPALNTMTQAIQHNRVVALKPNSVSIRRDGTESATEGSSSPIHDRRGVVSGAVMVFHEVNVARARTLGASYQAQRDSLTDLPNSMLLNDRLNEALTLSSRYQRKVAILLLDLDHFKHINDSVGHIVGDLLMQSVARRLFTCVRSSDTVARQGDDEFVIALWEVRQAQDAGFMATKILEELRKPHYINEHELHVTGTIGIVTYPDDGAYVEELIKKAGVAMSHAKENGRDRFQFFESAMSAQTAERQSLEASLRQAIARNELLLHYHSRLDLSSGEVLGAEALIRWRHPQLGLIPPRQFITIARECGLILPIGRWVLRQACQQARAWQLAGMPHLSMAVNISATELRSPDFASDVRDVLRDTGLEPRYLELELDETTLIDQDDSRSVADVLRELKEIGVLLALDGFGTIHSSLTSLRRFPINTLKLAPSVLRGQSGDEDGANIVSAMIDMGKSLQMLVVAKGVETQQQLRLLQQSGCLQGQGFYFSRPVPAEEFVGSLSCKALATASA